MAVSAICSATHSTAPFQHGNEGQDAAAAAFDVVQPHARAPLASNNTEALAPQNSARPAPQPLMHQGWKHPHTQDNKKGYWCGVAEWNRETGDELLGQGDQPWQVDGTGAGGGGINMTGSTYQDG